MPTKILFPVVGDRDPSWGVEFLQRLQQREPVQVELLSVQQPYTGHVRMFFDKDQVFTFHKEDAERELAPVRRALDAAGIPYRSHMTIGYGAEAIAQFAQEHKVAQVVLGPPRGRGFSELVLGSLTRQVRQLLQSAGAPCEVL
jgi:nucleotide-binding universal stress UspA family protein